MDLIDCLREQINYCRKIEHYKCGVYATTHIKREIIMKVISNIIPDITMEGIILKVKSYCSEVTFKNGSIIKIVSASDNSRGNRFNGCIIDYETSKKVIDSVITPSLIPIRNEDFAYIQTDNPHDRMRFVEISGDDVINSEKYKQILYVSSANRYKSYTNEDNYRLFEREYTMEFLDQNKARKVIEKEVNNDKVIFYEAMGIPKENITYETEFINKTKQTYLNIKGKNEMPELDFSKEVNVHLLIDTDIYDGYEVNIFDGIISVALHEIVNEKPVLKDYGHEKVC